MIALFNAFSLLLICFFPAIISFISQLFPRSCFGSLDSFCLFLVVFFTFVVIYYIFLYSWRKLNLSTQSFLCYLINNTYLLGLLLLLKYNITFLEDPIYLSNVSIISKYRYVLITIISLISIIVLIFFKYFPSFLPISYNKALIYPFLKEQMCLLLYTWNNGSIGDICTKLVDSLSSNHFYRHLFCIIEFVCIIIYRIIILIVFISFCFFDTSLNLIFYLLPITIIFWLINFYFYYFHSFLQYNKEYICDMLIIYNKKPITHVEELNLTVLRNTTDFSFQLSEKAKIEGLSSTKDLIALRNVWFKIAFINATFVEYQYLFKHLTSFIFLANLFCYSYLSYYFFLSHHLNAFFSNGNHFVTFIGGTLFKRYFHATKPLFRDARLFTHEKRNNELVEKSKGTYSPGHPLVGDAKGNEYHVEGYCTHGKNHGVEIHPESISDNSTKPGPQHYVPFAKPHKFALQDVGKPLPGSEKRLESPDTKAKIDAANSQAQDVSE